MTFSAKLIAGVLTCAVGLAVPRDVAAQGPAANVAIIRELAEAVGAAGDAIKYRHLMVDVEAAKSEMNEYLKNLSSPKSAGKLPEAN